ncbi:unnamed protein product [Cylicocyclus nassatus]|uniref:Trehalose-6-phosphate phosphatase C-terminal domain-containing protein n=1 Tax=Cylicocyclus nassatus TaxID=53992 RepID=A0AA36H524_CYLNA|nr:unnamed protein product [Cylicocyclus nassatus]
MCSVLCYRHHSFTRLQGIRNMSTMPEDACFVCYYAYGASAGREWYVNPAMQFKDDSISDADLALLNRVFKKMFHFDSFLLFGPSGRRCRCHRAAAAAM